ncbi:CaiB/BaiF CoA transferase family protein [Mycobacterium sp. NPDC003449]
MPTRSRQADAGLGTPLDGLRVLDLSQAISGPFIGRIFADLGADVVKVEWSNGDTTNRFGPRTGGITGLFTHMNAGKRGVGINRASPGAAELLLDLAGRADVVIENFRPGVLDRAGLGYADMVAMNPALIVISISGFGRSGPDAHRPAYAPVIHAESGLLARFAQADGRQPSDIPFALADQVAALHGAVAILAALRHRECTGTGQHIDMSMLEAMAATDDHISDAIDGRTEITESRGLVWAAHGGPILASLDAKAMWHRLSQYAGLVDPTPKDADLASKIAARKQRIAGWIASFSDRHALKREMDRAGVPWGELRSASTVFESPSLKARGCTTDVDDHIGGTRSVIRMPYRFSAARSDVAGAAPTRGQHNLEVLFDWLELGPLDVASLIAKGVLQPAGNPTKPVTTDGVVGSA